VIRLSAFATGCSPVVGKNGEKLEEPMARDDAPFAALAFKIMTDPYVGTLTFLRVYSGRWRARFSAEFHQAETRTHRTPGEMHANKREEISEVLAGDIAGGRFARHYYGRHALRPGHPIVLEAIEFPARLSASRSSRNQADQDRLVSR